MTKKTEKKTTRVPYCKPKLEKIQLIAEEAVLQGCKTNSYLFQGWYAGGGGGDGWGCFWQVVMCQVQAS